MDDIEKEYERRIMRAEDDEAYELSIGLRQYQDMFKVEEDEDDDPRSCRD